MLALLLFMLLIVVPHYSSIQLVRLSFLSIAISAILTFNSSFTQTFFLYNALLEISPLVEFFQILLLLLAATLVIIWADPQFLIVIILSIIGGLLLIASNDLLMIYLSIELQSFGVYILASHNRASALKYFLLGAFSSCFILLGITGIYSISGITNCSYLAIINAFPLDFPLLLIIAGLIFKVAAVPFHSWAPDIYNSVPTFVTAWLIIIPKIALMILIFKIDLFLLTPNIKLFLIASAILSIFIGSYAGLSQIQIKRLITFSSIAHVGYLLVFVGVDSIIVESFSLYLFQYLVTNLNTFFIIIAMGSASGIDIKFLKQLQLPSNPVLSICILLSLLSLAGIPPIIGFFAKFEVLHSSLNDNQISLALISLISSVISCSYYLKLISIIYFDNQKLVYDYFPVNDHFITVFISCFTLVLMLFIFDPSIILNCILIIAIIISWW